MFLVANAPAVETTGESGPSEPAASSGPLAIRAELQLLLLATAPRLGAAGRSRIKALARSGLDWQHVLSTVHRQGLCAMVYHRLAETCPEAVPARIMEQLRDHYLAAAERNLYLAAQLFRILRLLEAHGITATPMKGPALSAAIYRNLAFRRPGDLDLLVAQWDVHRAISLLESEGFRSSFVTCGLKGTIYLQSRYHHVLRRDADRIVVELHWRVAPRSFPLGHFDYADLQPCLEPVSLGGKTLLALGPERTLLLLCVHGAKHRWWMFFWICDVAWLIEARRDLDWERVWQLSRAAGAERILFVGLLLARNLLGATLPEAIARRAAGDRTAQALAAVVGAHVRGARPLPQGDLARFLFLLRIRERLRDKVAFCLGAVLFPDQKDIRGAPAQPPLFFLYQATRPLRLATRYLGLAARRLPASGLLLLKRVLAARAAGLGRGGFTANRYGTPIDRSRAAAK